jgi:hypothetical protein
VQLDKYIEGRHRGTHDKPSNQGGSETTAAALHMALVRIVEREGGYRAIEEIYDLIVENF